MNILTYGSTGSQGAPVAHKLLAAGHQVRAVARRPDRASSLVSHGAEVVPGDLSDAESLRRASAGMDGMFLMLPFGAQGDPFALIGNALEAAQTAGVKFLVFNTGGHTPDVPTGVPMMDFRIHLEQFVQDAGIPTVMVRPGVYMENFLGPWCLPSIQTRNAVAYPHRSEMRVSWITSQDLGSLVAAAFARPHLAGQRFTVGGPEALDGNGVATAFSAGLGRDITYHGITADTFAATMAGIMGPEAAAAIRAAYAHTNAQPNDAMRVDMNAVLEVLPVQLTRLEDWVRTHRAMFAASASNG